MKDITEYFLEMENSSEKIMKASRNSSAKNSSQSKTSLSLKTFKGEKSSVCKSKEVRKNEFTAKSSTTLISKSTIVDYTVQCNQDNDVEILEEICRASSVKYNSLSDDVTVSKETARKFDIEISTLKQLSDDISTHIDCTKQQSNAFQVLMQNSKSSHSVSTSHSLSINTSLNNETSEIREPESNDKNVTIIKDVKTDATGILFNIEKEQVKKDTKEVKKLYSDIMKINSNQELGKCAQIAGDLRSYFSNGSMQLSVTDLKNVSTFIVKADVHMSEDANSKQTVKTVLHESCHNDFKKTTRINNLLKENSDLMVSNDLGVSNDIKNNKNVTPRRNKPRWSLRIKLQPSWTKDSTYGYKDKDQVFASKSRGKLSTPNERKQEKIFNTFGSKNDQVDQKIFSQSSGEHTHLKLCKREVCMDLTAKQENLPMKDNKPDTEFFNEKLKTERVHLVEGRKHVEKHSTRDFPESNKKQLSLLNLDVKKSEAFNADCIIEIKNETLVNNKNSSKRNCNERLAPLFTKRRKLDPMILEARRLFLQSDVKEKDNQITDKLSDICSFVMLAFPTLSHVTQIDKEISVDETEASTIILRAKKQYIPFFDVTDFKQIIDLEPTTIISTKLSCNPVIGSPEKILVEMEKDCSDVRKIWTAVSTAVKNCTGKNSPKISPRNKRASKKRVMDLKSKEKTMPSCSALWPYKYKPMSSQEIVGNEKAAEKLRDWLSKWRSSLLAEDANSEDDFYSSDCSYSSSNENNQVAVLLGPHGSGKSASVYAVAEELGYSVLEVNASSKRPGKKILKELEEATKSHRIKKNKIKSLFQPLLKEDVAMSEEKIPENSLILLEDVDLIFDEDDGFITAAYQLASNTKRPIVMTCKDVCAHLNKLAPQQLRIYFQNVVGQRVSALLELISIAEAGYRLPHNFLKSLLQCGDLRKALLQLQYLLLSGSQLTSKHIINNQITLWQDMHYYLYKPLIRAHKKRKVKKDVTCETKMDSMHVDLLDNLADKLDDLSLVSSLIDVKDPALNLFVVEEQLSLSLDEDTTMYSTVPFINYEIAEWITERTLIKNNLKESNTTYTQNILFKKQLNRSIDAAFSNITSLILDRQLLSLEYIPFVRSVCRAEQIRVSMNSKRGNRFFHYLHTLNLPVTSTKANILAAACKMLHD